MTEFSEYGYVNFKTIKEPWNEYKLKDGSTLIIRFIMIKFSIGEDTKNVLGLKITSENIVGILAAPELRGDPETMRYTADELASSIVDDDIDFEEVRESWSEYVLEDGRRLFFKPVLTKVSRTDKLDISGDPIYLTQTQLLTKTG